MKRTLLALATLALAHCASASPAATQSWVADYVSRYGGGSSGESVLAPTTVTVYDDDGNPATVTFHWCQNTNLAFRVFDSNVDGMTNGLTFAKIGDLRYYNATNDACGIITGQVECTKMTFTGAVDTVVGNVTNTLYTGTNYVYGEVYYADVDGTRFRSSQDASNIHAFQPDTTNADARIFYVIETYVSDMTRSKIVTNPSLAAAGKRRFSFFDLFFPSAYAGWGEWVEVNRYTDPEQPEIGKWYTVYADYERHYYTDEPKTYSLEKVEWTLQNGETASYDIDLTMPFSIPGGVDVCKFVGKDYNTDKYDTDWLWGELAKTLPKGRYQQLSRSDSAANAIEAKFSQMKSDYQQNMASLLSMTCPDTDTKTLEKKKRDCGNNHKWAGTCGHWYCKNCDKTDTEPSVHNYSVSRGAGECSICANEHTGNGSTAKCLYKPSEMSEHRGWRPYQKITNGDLHYYCACECYRSGDKSGYCIDHEDPLKADSYFCASSYGVKNGCYRNWTCKRCGLTDHPGGNPAWGCTVSATSHAFDEDGTWSQIVTNGVNMCKGDYVCSHENDQGGLAASGCNTRVNEIVDHTPSNEVESVEIAQDNESHEDRSLCIRGCGYRFVETNDHNYGAVVDPGMVGDPIKPPNASGHFKYKFCGDEQTGEHDEYDGQCGHVYVIRQSAHQFMTNFEWVTEKQHSVKEHCQICRYERDLGLESHVAQSLFPAYSNNAVHAVWSTCRKCYGEYLVRTEAHTPSYYTERCNDVGDAGHEVSYQCDFVVGCGGWYVAATNEHAASSNVIGYVTAPGSRTHTNLVACAKADKGCEHSVPGWEDSCSKGPASKFVTVDDKDAEDYWTCGYCQNGQCGHVRHHFYKNDEEHYCTNEGSNHFRGPHVYVDNVCSVCDYPRPTDGGLNLKEYKVEIYTVSHHPDTVGGGICGYSAETYERPYVTNGVKIAESDRGEWILCHDDFGASLDEHPCYWNDGGYCACPYCSGSSALAKGCYCEYANEGNILKLTQAAVVESYYRHWSAAAQAAIDFSDPVYEIGDRCFEEAFISMPNLLVMYAPSVTNVGDGAFLRAFTNSVSLCRVDFSGLRRAGASAYEEAFVGCDLGSLVRFGSLEECGEDCFTSAFRDTNVRSLSFGSLTNAGGRIDFFGGSPSAHLTSLSAPVIDLPAGNYDEGFGVFSFSDMPNLQTLDLSRASSNAVSRIGDLSALSKLARLDFHEMTEVPSYWQDGVNRGRHAPTNNSSCMIIVADEMLEAWRTAPGWTNVQEQIVPYSNQVFRPYVTVSFDSDYGDPVSAKRIVRGSSVSCPTNIHKYANSYAEIGDHGAFVLDGWYVDAAKTVRYGGSAIESNVTLYAKWTDNRYVTPTYATYYSGDGSFMIGVDSLLGFSPSSVNYELRASDGSETVTLTGTANVYGYSEGVSNFYSGTGLTLGLQAVEARFTFVCPDGSSITSDWIAVTTN